MIAQITIFPSVETAYWIDTQQKLVASKYPLFILLLDKIVTKGFHATTQKVKPCQAMKYQFHP